VQSPPAANEVSHSRSKERYLPVFLTLFLTCVATLVPSTILLLAFGHRLPRSSRIAGVLGAAILTLIAGEAAGQLGGLPPGQVLVGEILVFAFDLVVILLRPRWNPIGQVFYGSFLASAVSYLAYAASYTLGAGLSPGGMVASGALFFLELGALTIAAWYTFDGLDVVTRSRWDRPPPRWDHAYRPKVSLQIAAYNEPADMLIETIRSVEAQDYPDFEVVVIDNNTEDPGVWRPVEEYCRGRPKVKFVHVDDWPGYKAGALNLALTQYTDPDAELVGVVDADYRLDPEYLKSVVGYFAHPDLAFVQTPQDYRDYEGNTYLTACYDAYKYFFANSMPSRNDRDSIIFAGTMGLLRRSLLEKLGGWEEWCITEDAEASLRILKSGYSGLYIERSFGFGIMPLTFAALKSQRFRWCFGGLQIARRHWRDLMPGARHPENRLTVGQRLDYLFGLAHWFNDLIYLGFTVTLLASAFLLITEGHVAIRPLFGAMVLLPSALIGSGLLRALWTLRQRTRLGLRRAILAFANWLSLSWTVALASLQALFRTRAVFMRTPKTAERPSFIGALWAARTETALTALLWTAGALTAIRGEATPFLLGLFVWQGTVYATSPLMSWLNVRSQLTPGLERRRLTEVMRERRGPRLVFYLGAGLGFILVAILAGVLLWGGSNPGTPQPPFARPPQAADGRGPLGALLGGEVRLPEPATTETPEQESPSPSDDEPSPGESPSPLPEESPTSSPTPTPTTTSSPAAEASPSPTPTGG
jgi:cellulose synthase/poly-beta-1,6-N-acetylglucosamine synthase-like glycosyltransferase